VTARKTKRPIDAARAEARKGTKAFTEWWQANPDVRPLVKTIIDDCQRMAKEADAEAENDLSDDPFGLPSDDAPRLTPEQEEGDNVARLRSAESAGDVRLMNAALPLIMRQALAGGGGASNWH